ncbi:MAG: protein kinase, partial [Verrucomicrobiales bacterium]
MSEEAYQSPQLVQPCPGCGGLLDVSDLEPFSNIHCPSCGTALRARTQFRNFSLQDLLGAGGMGQVFRALDCNLNRMVALKVLRKEYSEPGEGMGQLEREARLTASINHPHVVRIFSFGKDHGQFYLAMELVDQGSLDDLMTLQGKVSELQVLEIAMQVAQGLQAAHQLDLIHRDVKPGNILFADAHTAKIVDFGLAILMEEEAAQRGEIWGTPYYVAPEKLDQRPEDFRSDIYSLGGTLFHAIAGRPPYEAENASLVALKHLKSQNVSLQAFAPEVGSETTYVINKMMHKDPDERYGSYEELLQHLQFAHDRCQARAEQRAPSRQRVVVESEETDSRMAWIILSLLAALVIAGFFGFNYFQEQQKSREELAPTTSRPAAHERQAVRIEEATHQYQEGLTSLAEGDAAGALEYLGSLAALPQPQASFAALFQATAHLMLDEKDQAKEILEELYQDGLFSTEPGQLAMANALVETARMLTQQNRVNPSVMRLIDLNGPYAYSLFLFGISEWMEGRVSEAGEFFQAFLQLEPQGSVAWVAAFRPQAELFVADWKDYSELREAVTKENTSAGRQEILNKINEARGQIRTHYGIIHQVYDELIAATDRLISHAQEEEVQAVEVERATRQVEL